MGAWGCTMTSIGRLAFLFCLLSTANCLAGQPAPLQVSRQQLIRILQSPTEPLDRRIAALKTLSRTKLPGKAILVKLMEESSQELQRVLARQLAASPNGAEALLKSVEQGKTSARLLRQAEIRGTLQEAKVPGLKQRLEKLTENLQSLDEEIAPLIRQRRQGFLAATTSQSRGKVLFQKHCAGCHRVTSDGARVGPELKAIGRRGLDRLLEDLLDPHRNVDPNFRRTTVVTTGGEILSGLLVRSKGTQRLLIDQQGKEVVLDEKEIDEAIVSPLSAMPTGLAGHLKAAEFYDVMAYLLSLQAITSPPQKPLKK